MEWGKGDEGAGNIGVQNELWEKEVLKGDLKEKK